MYKKLIFPLFIFTTFITLSIPKNAETNWQKAVTRATQENKNILLVFSGSTWCSLCIELNKTILEKDEFNEQIKDDLVFVYLDYPRVLPPEEQAKKLRKMTPEERKTYFVNMKLFNKYNLKEAFPIICLLDKSTAPLGEIDIYSSGELTTLQQFINDVTVKSKNFTTLTEKFNNSDNKKAKAILLYQYLKDIPLEYISFHQEKINQLKLLTPELANKLILEINQKKSLNAIINKVLFQLHQGKVLEARKTLMQGIEQHSNNKSIKQQLTFFLVYTYNGTIHELDTVVEILNKTIAIDPKSTIAKDAKAEKEQIVIFRASQK